MKPLRIVPETPDPPETQWLALSAEIASLEANARRLRAIRQGLKPAIMQIMRQWGCSDEQVTAALERGL